MRLLTDACLGPRALASGFKLMITHPSILLLSGLVGGVAFGASLGGIYASLKFGPEVATYLLESLGFVQSGWLRTTLDVIFQGVGIVIAIVLLPWLVALIGFPLCIPLSERTDAILGGEASAHSFFTTVRMSILSVCLTTVIGISVSAMLYLLSWIPIIGVIFGVLASFVWTPLVLAYAVYENSLDRRGLSFSEKIAFVNARRLASWGVGLQTQLLISVPFVNLIGLPLAMVAGAVAVREIEAENEHGDWLAKTQRQPRQVSQHTSSLPIDNNHDSS